MAQKRLLTLEGREPGEPSYTAAYFDRGAGIPMILLHGFLGEGSCWLPLVDRLQSQIQSEIRCISLDLLGFGDSSKPMIRYDIAQEVAFVRRFVAALDLGPCYFVGHSFGGWVSVAYGLAYPDAMRGLVLAAAAGIRDDSFCGRYDHLRPLLWRTPIVDLALSLAKPFSGLVGQRSLINQLSWFRRELMANPAACSFLVDRLRPEDAIDTVEKEIHRLRVPTLVVTGDRDETIPLWHSEAYAKAIPNAKLVVIPNADHALPQEYSAELAEAISQQFSSKAL
ncbi:MAG TPA: alpha/beta hydrolase [Thermosynechococcaceae cyanobacterium]